MSFRVRGLCLLRATPPGLQRNPNRVVIPRLPSQTPPKRGATASSASSEYHDNKHIPAHTGQFLPRDGVDDLRRQEQLQQFGMSTEAQAEQVWRDSKPHLRKHQALVEEMGVEGAVRETLDPSRTSFHDELKARPLDRAILEEIYLGLHGRRVERRLKKGVSWEHWIAKGDGTAPVYTTSRKGQQTFAFGGHIKQVGQATHPLQFPVLRVPGKEALHNSNAGSGTSGAPSREGRGAMRKNQVVHRELLVPEVAFIGRTSSGKSALVNAIVNAMIAPYGHLQGTTSALHFYSVANKVVLVDCPGYGYYNPMETPQLDAENAVKAMRAYLKAGALRQRRTEPRAATPTTTKATGQGDRQTGSPLHGVDFDDDDDVSDASHAPRSPVTGRAVARPLVQPRNLKRVFLCVPARGLQHTDMAYCRLLEELGIPFAVVLTKTDAAPIRLLARLADHTRCQLVQFSQCKELMLTSALRLAGIDKMQSLIGSVAVTEDRMAGATMDFSAIV